ncbi:hypothetical protein [Actinomadura flavalba]|uniref:hypothetical protein n=1 Tax=Actinomadura flavalba TaxID=1120938 RepID=UPI000363037E|nr:hypothetical protein [Actinomadura flavalba]
MAEVLVVPVRLAALHLDTAVGVVEPVDFSRLPYVDPVTGRDVRPGVPYLSDQVLPDAFTDQDFLLRPGVHLHWSLPDALTRLTQRDGATDVPAVPDRWLVTRSRDGRSERSWVVESDFLAAPGDAAATGVAFPVPGDVPYRRLGRAVPLEQWRRDAPGDRLAPLTAIGHGDPAFAAFYPGCHSVFGLHDPDHATARPPSGTRYDIVGWFTDPDRDALARLATGDGWRAALADGRGWGVPDGSARPGSAVCHAALVFRPDGRTVSPLLRPDDAGVFVGATATEALAAHLGAVLPGVSPDEAENLLEALAHADELETRPLDAAVRLAAERHADGFRPVPSGQAWTIRREDRPGADPATRQLREALTLPRSIGDLLNRLNVAQEALDRAGEESVSLRERLFADWHRYQQSAHPGAGLRESYPDPDEVRAYLEWQIDHLDDRAGLLRGLDDAVTAARAALDSALAAFDRDAAAPAGAAFVVQPVPAPVFHLPAEPVVLLTGDPATPSDRHGRDGAGRPDGLLPCRVVTAADPRDPAALGTAVTAGAPAPDVWAHNPWHPVLLHWEAEFLALGGPGDNDDAAYAPTFVTDAYELPPGAADLRARPGYEAPTRPASVYTGTTVLSQSAGPVLAARVLRYLAGALPPEYTKATGTALDPADVQKDPDALLTWYAEHGADARLRTLVALYRHLAEHENATLAQVLGGFNDALVMRRLVRQLPVQDPHAFPDYRDFARDVARATGDDTRHAPDPLSGFHPVRAGAMRLTRLRIVDNFGVACDLDASDVATTARTRVEGRPGWAAMPPRLAQPSRLTFRWLDSDHGEREMNDVPVTSPVCGWVVPDDLDDGLAFHADDGTPLGLLTAVPDPDAPALARWRPAPGGGVPTAEAIPNPHLRAVAARVRAGGPDALAAFVAALDDLTAGVEPEDHDLGAFTVRPLAVLRARLDLELMGLPAVHQDWNVFRQDMRRSTRDTTGFPAVALPVRVGAADRLGDGLAGYWREDDATGAFRPVTTAPPLTVAADLPPVVLTLLADPRAPIHVTSGVLPGQAVSVPPAQYRTALDALRVTAFTAPVLLDGESLALPLPDVAGHRWSWRERNPAGWTDRPPDPVHDDAGAPARLVAREGWLTLLPDDA